MARLKEVAERLDGACVALPQRLKPVAKRSLLRSGEPLRHPKTTTKIESFTRVVEIVHLQSEFKLTHHAPKYSLTKCLHLSAGE
jgi:hypothetical protein